MSATSASAGIWEFADRYGRRVAETHRISLGEGRTPLVRLPLGPNGETVALKREDCNPNGSHKDRALAFQVSAAAANELRQLVISSSGNGAVSAAAYCAAAGIELFAFLSPDTVPAKIAAVEAFGAHAILSDSAISLAKHASTALGVPNLRPSTHGDAIEGFKSIGFEIAEELPHAGAVYTFGSSGTSAIGIAQALHATGMPARLDVLHTGSLGGLDDEEPRSDLFGRLTGGVSRRARELREALKRIDGSLRTVADADVLAADELLRSHGVLVALEGCASLAACLADLASHSVSGEPVVVLTGRRSLSPTACDAAGTPIVDAEAFDAWLLELSAGWR